MIDCIKKHISFHTHSIMNKWILNKKKQVQLITISIMCKKKKFIWKYKTSNKSTRQFQPSSQANSGYRTRGGGVYLQRHHLILSCRCAYRLHLQPSERGSFSFFCLVSPAIQTCLARDNGGALKSCNFVYNERARASLYTFVWGKIHAYRYINIEPRWLADTCFVHARIIAKTERKWLGG